MAEVDEMSRTQLKKMRRLARKARLCETAGCLSALSTEPLAVEGPVGKFHSSHAASVAAAGHHQAVHAKEPRSTRPEAVQPTCSVAALDKPLAVCIGCGVEGEPMATDAVDVSRALLRGGYCIQSLLTGAQASKDSIMQVVETALALQESGGTVFLFISCHGTRDEGGDLYLLPHGIARDCQNVASCAVPFKAVRTMCLRSQADVMVVLDCCHSGAAVAAQPGKVSRKWRSVETPGRVFLTSSTPGQDSFMHAGKRNSVFTTALLNCLHGHLSPCACAAGQGSSGPAWESEAHGDLLCLLSAESARCAAESIRAGRLGAGALAECAVEVLGIDPATCGCQHALCEKRGRDFAVLWSERDRSPNIQA